MRVLPAFVAGHSLNALSIGIQLVLVAWLATSILQLPARQVGWVQAVALLPNLLLLLLAGVTADRRHAGRILVVANLGLMLCHMFALVCFLSGLFNLTTLLIYALALGVGNAFVQTSREKVVAELSEGKLQRFISLAGIFQFVAQGLGIIVASFTDTLGPPVLFSLQIVLCALSAVAYLSLVPSIAATPTARTNAGAAIAEAFGTVWRSIPVRHIILLVGFNGLMHLGMFIVLLPLLARDVMGFGSFEYGLLQLAFVVGTVLSHLLMLYKRVQFPGQNILFCLLYTGVIGFAISAQPTVAGLYSLVFVWGGVAGISANLSRVVVQSLMPAALRGRAMALYQLALFGMAPFGALLAGYLVERTDVWFALRTIGYSSLLLFGLSLFSRGLWAVTGVSHQALSQPKP